MVTRKVILPFCPAHLSSLSCSVCLWALMHACPSMPDPFLVRVFPVHLAVHLVRPSSPSKSICHPSVQSIQVHLSTSIPPVRPARLSQSSNQCVPPSSPCVPSTSVRPHPSTSRPSIVCPFKLSSQATRCAHVCPVLTLVVPIRPRPSSLSSPESSPIRPDRPTDFLTIDNMRDHLSVRPTVRLMV